MGIPGVHAGDIYRSEDGGLHWAHVTAGQTISPVTAIAHDALTPTIVYAATGWDHTGSGLLRSGDGGQSWQPIGEEHAALDAVRDLAAEKGAPYRVFALTDAAGLYVSGDHGDSWSQAAAPLTGFNVEEILFTDEDPSLLYAAVSDHSWYGPGLYRSDDGAQSWERAAGALGRVGVYSLATATDTGRVFVYAGTTGGEQRAPQAVEGLAPQTATAGEGLVAAGVYRRVEVDTGEEAAAQTGWRHVNENGFGDADNVRVTTLDVFDGRLYAGTWNVAGDAEVWRSDDGEAWSAFTPPWSGVDAVMTGERFGSHLYLGVRADGGAQIWRSDGTSWSQVADGGFDDGNNGCIGALQAFAGHLYAATSNGATGLEVWRTVTGNAGDWEQVNVDGFGAAGTEREATLAVYGGALYVGLARNGVAELWRSFDGDSWTTVFDDGLGDPLNEHVTSLAAFDGAFYMGLRNRITGGQLWRAAGGSQWTRVFAGGLGVLDNQMVNGLQPFYGELHLLFSNSLAGSEAWHSDGEGWRQSADRGWGNSHNSSAANQGNAMVVFDGRLYVGTFNFYQGGEVWRLQRGVYLPLVVRYSSL